MFDALTNRLSSVFDGLTGRGALTEADVDAALREVRLALIEADVSRKKRKEVIDQVAACLILQGWLDAQPGRHPPLPPADPQAAPGEPRLDGDDRQEGEHHPGQQAGGHLAGLLGEHLEAVGDVAHRGAALAQLGPPVTVSRTGRFVAKGTDAAGRRKVIIRFNPGGGAFGLFGSVDTIRTVKVTKGGRGFGGGSVGVG